MKLIYQWLIILALAGILWGIHTYGGTGCSKSMVPSNTQLVVVRRVPTPEIMAAINEVPKVPQTPSSKKRAKKRKARLSKEMSERVKREIQRYSQDPDWDFVEMHIPGMTQ